jgi:hypothetical protein
MKTIQGKLLWDIMGSADTAILLLGMYGCTPCDRVFQLLQRFSGPQLDGLRYVKLRPSEVRIIKVAHGIYQLPCLVVVGRGRLQVADTIGFSGPDEVVIDRLVAMVKRLERTN